MPSQTTYVQTSSPRFRVEGTAEGQQIVIPAQRNLFVMAFLLVWLTGWTIGGFTAMATLFTHFQPFVAVWCCAWVLGEGFAITTLLWMLAGRETLRIVRGDLEWAAAVPGYARRRFYKGADIRDLTSSAAVANPFARGQMSLPLFQAPASGCVKFNYGARTIFVGAGLDEPEGRLIVDLLKSRLPKTATAP